MTQLLVAGGLGRVFGGSTQAAVYQKLLLRQQEEERLRRDRKEDIASDASEVFDLALTVISASEATEFGLELDLYGTGTVAALQANEEELVRSGERLNTMLAKAYVLPDGRRAFKTEDGTRVFDENGVELDAETITPDAVGDNYQRFEPYWEEKMRFLALEQERTDILDYQDKLDSAHERLDAGDLSRKEFDTLREELKADMPDAVRAHVPSMEVKAEREANALQAEELDITDDIVPSAPAAKAFTPAFNGLGPA